MTSYTLAEPSNVVKVCQLRLLRDPGSGRQIRWFFEVFHPHFRFCSKFIVEMCVIALHQNPLPDFSMAEFDFPDDFAFCETHSAVFLILDALLT